MSAIPPNWMSSIIQSHGAQRRANEARDKEEVDAAERRSEAGAAKAANIIENDDTDSSAYADAEGAGSQGKLSPAEEEETAAPVGGGEEEKGDHLDIEA